MESTLLFLNTKQARPIPEYWTAWSSINYLFTHSRYWLTDPGP
jgi:hypothetical protein